ncbi:YdcH family protein [Sphingomonas sp. CJ20]
MNPLLKRLIAAHRALDREIRKEVTRRLPDRERLAQLKKERLAVKDRLFRHMPDPA